MASAKAGARSSESRPTSPSTFLSSSSVTARCPRSREPAIALSISSKVSLLPTSETRDDRLTFCASGSDGLRSNSGARLTRRTVQADAGLGAPAPTVRRSPGLRRRGPAPDILAFSRSGARHTPVADPSNCAGAVARSDRAIEPEQRQQRTALLRRQLRFDADFAVPELVEIEAAQRRAAGFAAIVTAPLSCGASRSRTACALARSAVLRVLVDDRAPSFSAHRTGTEPSRIEPRRQRRRKRRDQRGDLAERGRA